MRPTPLTLRAVLAFAALFLLAACGRKSADSTSAAPKAEEKPEDWVQTEDTTPEQRTYLEHARGIVQAVAARDYAAFHAGLSSHARARMSLNQFAPEDDDNAFDRNEKSPRRNVDLPAFLELMQRMEARFGAPAKPLGLHIHSTEAEVLSGAKKEGLDALDVMFAIGNMPKEIPAAIRKASLRARIGVELSAAQLAETAKAYNITVDELKKDADFQPYLTLKLVLVEDPDGQLRVGYFEFLPPSMMD